MYHFYQAAICISNGKLAKLKECKKIWTNYLSCITKYFDLYYTIGRTQSAVGILEKLLNLLFQDAIELHEHVYCINCQYIVTNTNGHAERVSKLGKPDRIYNVEQIATGFTLINEQCTNCKSIIFIFFCSHVITNMHVFA